MAKTFHDLLKSMTEWSVPTAHTAHVTDRMSTRTDLSRKAKKPSVRQLEKVPMTKAEREKKGIHFFQLDGSK
jgi:hypothetical protein